MFWSPPSVVFVFPFCCVLRLFSHELEGADPSSYEAYPRVIEPAPRPSEGPGSAIVRGRLDTAFRDTFFALMCLAEGHRDPGTIFGGEGALSLPPQVPFSYALVSFFPPQVVFFCSSGATLWRLCWNARRMNGVGWHVCRTKLPPRMESRIPLADPRTPQNFLRTPCDTCPSPLLRFFVRFRGKCCAFFPALCFGKSP